MAQETSTQPPEEGTVVPVAKKKKERFWPVVLVVALVVVVAWVHYRTRPPAKQEPSEKVLYNLRDIIGWQQDYHENEGTYATLAELADYFFAEEYAGGRVNEYVFDIVVSENGQKFTLTAVPEKPAADNVYYYADETSIRPDGELAVHYAVGKEATASSPLVGE